MFSFSDLSHHILATNKAKADLEKSQQEMTKIQDRYYKLLFRLVLILHIH